MPAKLKLLTVLCALPLAITIIENGISMDEKTELSCSHYSSYNRPLILDLNELPLLEPEPDISEKERIRRQARDFLESISNEIKEKNNEKIEPNKKTQQNTQHKTEEKQINTSFSRFLRKTRNSKTNEDKFDLLTSALKVAENDCQKARAYLYLGDLSSNQKEKKEYYLLALNTIGQENLYPDLSAEIYLHLGGLSVHSPEQKLFLLSKVFSILPPHRNRCSWSIIVRAYMEFGSTLQYGIKNYDAAIDAYDAALTILEQNKKQDHRHYEMILKNKEKCLQRTEQHLTESVTSHKQARLFSDTLSQNDEEEQHRSKRARLNKATTDEVTHNANSDRISIDNLLLLTSDKIENDASSLISMAKGLNNQQAIVLLRIALRQAKQGKNSSQISQIYTYLGLKSVASPEKQKEYFLKALKIEGENKLYPPMARTYVRLAILSPLKSEEQMQYFLKAQFTLEKLDKTYTKAQIWLKIGNYFNEAKQQDLAINAYDHVIKLYSSENKGMKSRQYWIALKQKTKLLEKLKEEEQEAATHDYQ